MKFDLKGMVEKLIKFARLRKVMKFYLKGLVEKLIKFARLRKVMKFDLCLRCAPPPNIQKVSPSSVANFH